MSVHLVMNAHVLAARVSVIALAMASPAISAHLVMNAHVVAARVPVNAVVVDTRAFSAMRHS
jgi:hypothetical protein